MNDAALKGGVDGSGPLDEADTADWMGGAGFKHSRR